MPRDENLYLVYLLVLSVTDILLHRIFGLYVANDL